MNDQSIGPNSAQHPLVNYQAEQQLAQQNAGLPTINGWQPNYDQEQESSFDFYAFWRIFLKRRWFIFFFLIIALLAGVITSYIQTPLY